MADRDEDLGKLLRAFSGSVPRPLDGFLATAESGTPYFQGTAVRALGRQYVRNPSGLYVPEYVNRPAEPLDTVMIYTTLEELTGVQTSERDIVAALHALPVGDVLVFAAHWLSRFRASRDLTIVDLEYLDLLPPDLATKARRLLAADASGRHLVTPQQLMLLACRALAMSPNQIPTAPDDRQRVLDLSLLPLALGDLLTASFDGENDSVTTAAALSRELVSNQIFHAPRSGRSLLARWHRTWHELPNDDDTVRPGYLEALYLEATGAELLDVAAVSIMMGASALTGSVMIEDTSLTALHASEQIDAVLNVVAGTYEQVIAEIEGSVPSPWNVDVLRRYPALRFADELTLVIDPTLLNERVFGWLPYWDVRTHLEHDRKRRGEFERALRRYNEAYALEAVVSMSGKGRVFDEKALQEAYMGRGIKIADCAIEYPDSWVVLDVSTHVTTRATAHGLDASALAREIETLVVTKARQLQSTIDRLRADESRLTRSPSIGRRTYMPVILATEGFPINPLTTAQIIETLQSAGLLISEDIGPIHVLDLEELEMVESIQEAGGPDFATLLRLKSDSSLARSALRDYLFANFKPQSPRRVRELADAAMNRVKTHLIRQDPP